MADKTAHGSGDEDGGGRRSPGARLPGIVLEYRLEEPVSLVDAPAFGHVERWAVSVRVDHPDAADHRRNIGSAQLIVLHLEPGVTLADLTDTVSGDWVDPGPMRTHADTDSEPAGTSFLVLDRLWIEPDSRGNGLGPIVAACAILRLGRGCRLAACYPAPFEPSRTSEDRDRSIEALGRIWAKAGFKPWNDGVWMLDLHTTDLRDALDRLLPQTGDGLL